MNKKTTPLKGIYKAQVLSADVLPDRDIHLDGEEAELNKVKYGFNCEVAVYDIAGNHIGNAEGGGAHNLPLSHTSPAIKFFRALQNRNILSVSGMENSIGAYLLVEVEPKIIPALGQRNVIKKFISRREMSLADWENSMLRSS